MPICIARQCIIVCPVCVQDSWEIVEGLRGGQGNVQEPEKQEGFMLKRRKWPMKGWHKVGAAFCMESAFSMQETVQFYFQYFRSYLLYVSVCRYINACLKKTPVHQLQTFSE